MCGGAPGGRRGRARRDARSAPGGAGVVAPCLALREAARVGVMARVAADANSRRCWLARLAACCPARPSQVGLGTGSTAAFAVARVGELLASGELTDIVAVPTSVATYEQAKSLGIPLETLDTCPHLDVAIDGADEVDPQLNLVKGGGGALLREKMVEVCADKFIVIVDESKLCDGLGPGFPLPVEITPFCHMHTLRKVAALPSVAGCKAVLRMGTSSSNKPDGDEPAVTDNGNYIVDLHFTEPIKDAAAAASELKNTVGVVDHGLFIGMSSSVIVASAEKGVYEMMPEKVAA